MEGVVLYLLRNQKGNEDSGTMVKNSLSLKKSVSKLMLTMNDPKLIEEIKNYLQLLYRNNNQHKTSIYWRKLLSMKKIISFYQSLSLIKICKLTSSNCPSMNSIQFIMILEYYFLALHQWIVNKASLDIKDAHKCISTYLVATTFFLPFAFIVQAMLSRFHFIFGQIAKNIEVVYAQLQILHTKTPTTTTTVESNVKKRD